MERRGHVLVVGGDARRREQVVVQLRRSLPEGTSFVEAGDPWGALAHAPQSRMVLLSGDLGDVSAGALERVLARRYPSLPVVSLQLHPAATGAAAYAGI